MLFAPYASYFITILLFARSITKWDCFLYGPLPNNQNYSTTIILIYIKLSFHTYIFQMKLYAMLLL